MKTTYQTPHLTEFGPVSKLTGRYGDPSEADAIFENGDVVPGSQGQGSQDFCIFEGSPTSGECI